MIAAHKEMLNAIKCHYDEITKAHYFQIDMHSRKDQVVLP